MPLGALGSIPGLAGYLGGQEQDRLAQQAAQQGQLGQLQQVGALQGILAKIREAQDAPVRSDILKAQLQEHLATVKQKQMIANLNPDQLKDPKVLRQLGMHDPRFMAEADRLEKLAADAATLGQMKGTEVPVQRMTTQPSGNPAQDEAEAIAALKALPPGQTGSVQQVMPGEQGTMPALTTRTGGLFDSLTESTNPQIAAQAKQLKAALERSGSSIPAQYWQSQQKNLSDKETALLNRPEPIKIVIGSDGRPTYAQGVANIVGSTPGSSSGRGTVSAINPENSSLKGESYVSTLDQTEQQVVRGLINYTLPLNMIPARSGQDRQNYFAHAKQTDPSFDVKEYPARQKVVNDFTSGKTADNIVAIDQGINHMGTLNRLGEALQNGDVKAINAAVNFVKDQTGNPSVNNFATAKQAVGTELMRVFRQVNASEIETLAWEKRFGEANSPAQIKGAITTASDLLVGRLNAINNRWDKGMKVTTGYPNLLSDEAKQALESFGGKLPNKSSGIPEYATEADAIKAGAKGKVRIGGRNATIE